MQDEPKTLGWHVWSLVALLYNVLQAGTVMLIISALTAVVLFYGWNFTLPEVLGVQKITYIQSIVIVFCCNFFSFFNYKCLTTMSPRPQVEELSEEKVD